MHNKRIVTPLPVLTLLALCWPFTNFLDVNKTMLRAPQVFDVLAYLSLCIAAVVLGSALCFACILQSSVCPGCSIRDFNSSIFFLSNNHEPDRQCA